jgi:hypothetical protein
MNEGDWDGIVRPVGEEGVKNAQEAPRHESPNLDIEDFPDDAAFIPGDLATDPYLKPLQDVLIDNSPPITTFAESSRSIQPMKLSHRLKYVAHLKAMGMTNKEIAEKAGYTQSRISIVLNSPHVSAEVERMRRHLLDRDPDVALRAMIPKALRAIDDVLSTTPVSMKEKVWKKDAALQLFDRTHGKPTQKIEASGNLLSDLFALLDQRDAPQAPRDVPAESRNLDSGEESVEAELSPQTEGASDGTRI